MDKNRERFEAWYQKKYCMLGDDFDRRGERYQYKTVQLMWEAWQESRADMTPACWRTYYPDTDEEAGRAHSESGPESCAKRIASEIGGYVVPVYYGEPQQCASGLKVKGE
ncbi:hypothetical protein FZI51_12630 [Cronobacter sakazakii]|uniref:hypothetical protein n=1 Tax=Cronobacter sakazakii TaxID=28141 RepID=UPI00124B4C1F|nr:hypothetical protein [Cronobacter sakazakii]EJQ2008222.1 hypothetical protein [Cronobacter sakazakii]EJQ2088520.1 hypothetical protein [Cronobacter sakazakii]EJR9311709.1 hypothetical protein [Cronobacter sakazakii]EJR9316332.1 hypothetical protein [Cronobacter sakazakii]EJR9320865.1 hypothetical protein [Cronobacter sakazakii]